jgi:protein TonB
VEVTERGEAENCRITESSGFPRLDQATCVEVLRRAKFRPATKDGIPVRSRYASRIRWVIPQP